MPKVLVPYYSSYGHIEQMAEAVAAGARETGATVDVKRVPETAPEDVARAAHFKLEQAAPVASVTDLENYDAIVGLPYSFQGQLKLDEITGSSPYGATNHRRERWLPPAFRKRTRGCPLPGQARR